MRGIAVIVFTLGLLSSVATAEDTCPQSEWQAEGSARLAITSDCDSFVLATEAAAAPWSWGAAVYRGELPAAFAIELRYQRLTPDREATFEVHLPGGALLFKPQRVGVYESEAQFARDGWSPLERKFDERVVRIEQRGTHVTLWVDGVRLERRFSTAGARTLKIGAKGYPGLRSRVRLRAVSVTALQ